MAYTRMDPETKEKWVKALRSGRYKQTTETLTTSGEAYCCLGVLAKCTKTGALDRYNDLVFKVPKKLKENYQDDVYVGEGELPPFILDKFNLSAKAQTKLIKLNDGDPTSNNVNLCLDDDGKPIPANNFEYIADWIEKNL